jgi:ABC-type transport system substrate-binding protein
MPTRPLKKIVLVLFCMFYALSLMPQLPNMFGSVSNAQSCPAFNMTQLGAPNSLNQLTAQTYSAYYLLGLEYLNLIPPPSPSGILGHDDSVTDWYSANANYTQWTFNVKPGLKWSNGQTVNASDILATYSDKFALNSSYDIVGIAPEITNEYALNSSAAVFDLNVSNAHFAEQISDFAFTVVLPAQIADLGGGYPNLGTTITDGPFYTSNYTAGQTEMTLLKNPYFSPVPNICQVHVTFIEQLSQDATYLISGTTDLAEVDYATAQSVLSQNPNIRISNEPGLAIQTLEYNVTSYPYNMTAFRQALAFGIDENAIASQVFKGYATPAFVAQGTEPNYSSWYDPSIMKYSFNQSASMGLLNSINIKKGTDGKLQYPNGTDITLTLYADSDAPSDVLTAGIVTSDLQTLGFTVNQITTSKSNIDGDFPTNQNNIQQAMILYTQPAVFFGDPWLSAEPGWITYWTPGVPNTHWEYPPSEDTLYQNNYTAITETDNTTQEKQLLDNIQQLNAEYLPTIVLSYPDLLFGYNTKTWTNWPTPPSSYIFYVNINWNDTAWATISPASGASTSTTTTGLISSTTSGSASSQTTSFSSSSSSSSSTGPSSSNNTLEYAAIAIIVVVIIIAGSIFALRRNRAAR